MTFKEFREKWAGKPVDFDGIYPNQCMDLMHFYVYEVLGLTDKYILAAPSAYLAYANFKWDTYFEKIENTPDGVPKEGDIIFWQTGQYGHVAIFISGNVDFFDSFDANWPVGSLPHVQRHDYNGVIGWLRPKKVGNEYLEKIAELETKIEELRTQRETYRNEIKELEENLKKCKDAKDEFATNWQITQATLEEKEGEWERKEADFIRTIEGKDSIISDLEWNLDSLLSKTRTQEETIKKLKKKGLEGYSKKELIKALLTK